MSLSSSTTSSRRPSQHALPDQSEQTEVRRSSKYDIYGTATKPFGESYRRSLVVQDPEQDHEQEREDSSVDTDSVDDTMGCSTSRTEVGDENKTKGTFSAGPRTELPATSDSRCVNVTSKDDKKIHNNNEHNREASKKLSDFEIIYGEAPKNNIGNNITDVYSEVKKPVKETTGQKTQNTEQTPRENLMKQIRERREESNEIDQTNDVYSTIKDIKRIESCKLTTHTEESETEDNGIKNIDEVDKSSCNVVEPVSFIEEEYSYEPGNNETTKKLVVRSRSLVNLEETQTNNNGNAVNRPNAMKITTKPDGTIRYGLRPSETAIDDSDDSPVQESELKNNYVSSIKNAFDAAIIENQNRDKTGKAEAFDGLRQYFHDNKHGLQELLINNNVVIIEPFRHEPPKSPSDKSDGSSQRTCRITGATIKSPVSEQNQFNAPFNTLPRRNTKCQQNVRQGFYHPIKNNKEIIDTELPDPEKVKSAREWFEQIFKSKSSSEIPSKKSPTSSFFNAITGRSRITAEVKVIQEGKHVCNEKRKLGRYTIDQAMREDLKRYPHHRRWTDTGSLSSGVSSDFSCDQDCEFHHHDCSTSGSNQEILEEYSTEEEDGEYFYPYDDDERHPVSTEVLQKIRACGTTITYYGGKVISRSHGQFRSPMTMTIMDEIRQGGGASEGRKKFEPESEEPYLGVKFRLVKSHSCGSRLEIAGTEEDNNNKLLSPRHESFRGESIAEETYEFKEVADTKNEAEENHASLEEEEDRAEADRYVTNVDVDATKNPQTMTWAELKLKEARKQWHCAPEAVRVPSQDMEFETFEVLDESKPRKTESNEAGRG